MIRTFAQETVDELAHWATVPVVNALSDEHHPCQALADLLTIEEAFGDLDGTHGSRSSATAATTSRTRCSRSGALAGVDVTIACPPEYAPDPTCSIARDASRSSDRASSCRSSTTPQSPSPAPHAVYADVWASMGEEAERDVAQAGARARTR